MAPGRTPPKSLRGEEERPLHPDDHQFAAIEDIMLCCRQNERECTCDQGLRVSGIEALRLLEEQDKEWIDAYGDDDCLTCIHVSQATCPPYVDWLYELAYMGRVPSYQLKVCPNFTTFDEVLREDK